MNLSSVIIMIFERRKILQNMIGFFKWYQSPLPTLAKLCQRNHLFRPPLCIPKYSSTIVWLILALRKRFSLPVIRIGSIQSPTRLALLNHIQIFKRSDNTDVWYLFWPEFVIVNALESNRSSRVPKSAQIDGTILRALLCHKKNPIIMESEIFAYVEKIE